MKLAIEPKGIDLVVEPHKYTESDHDLMSKIISHYNATGKLLKLRKPKTPLKTNKHLTEKQ